MDTPASKTFSSRRTLGAGALIAIAVGFVALTIVASFALRGLRLDLTENRLYSIAAGTERILEGIGEPVTLYFFFSDEPTRALPELRSYADRVRELLQEMAERSDGKIQLSL